jgi:hypothetical protein
MKLIQTFFICVLCFIAVETYGNRPTSLAVSEIMIVVQNDTVVFQDSINKPIPSFNRKTIIEIVKNDSIKIDLVLEYYKNRKGQNVFTRNHVFYFKGKKLKGQRRWETDMPFFSKLFGIGFKNEEKSIGGKTVSSTKFGSYSKLNRSDDILLYCKETIYFEK